MLMKKKIVVLTGAGMSVESGLKTFRDADGLWEEYPVQQVATHEGWEADPTLVTNFYNMLRKKCWGVLHIGIVEQRAVYDAAPWQMVGCRATDLAVANQDVVADCPHSLNAHLPEYQQYHIDKTIESKADVIFRCNV